MLGQHPQLYGLPETYLFTHETVEDWWREYEGTFRVDGLLRAVAEIVFGGQTWGKVNRAGSWLKHRSSWSTEDVFKALGRKVYPRVLVEKTPKMSARMEYLDRIAHKFPSARFLHLVRHPLGQVQSRLERISSSRAGSFQSQSDHRTLAQEFSGYPELLWYRRNSHILTHLEGISAEQQMCLRGEDLLTDPDVHLRTIANWLGVRSDTSAIEAMKHPEASPFAKIGPSNARSGVDMKFFLEPTLRAPRPITQSLDSPLPWRADGRGLPSLVRDLAHRFGYR